MKTPPKDAQTLQVPEDIGAMLGDYAAKLSQEFGFTVTPQQAFERFARVMLMEQSTGKGAADGHAAAHN